MLGASLLTPFAAAAAIVHIANQAFPKITMFFVAGAVQRRTGKTNIDELAGIGNTMPWTMAAFTMAALSFIGLPLFAGFITKWYLSLGAMQAESWWFIVIIVVSSLLNAACWLPIVYLAFFSNDEGRPTALTGPMVAMLAPTLLCAVYIVVLGATAQVPGMPFSLAEAAVRFVFKM